MHPFQPQIWAQNASARKAHVLPPMSLLSAPGLADRGRLSHFFPPARQACHSRPNTTMEMAAAASAPTVVECSAIDQVAQPSAQSTATAPTVLPRGKKENDAGGSGGKIEETSCPTGRGQAEGEGQEGCRGEGEARPKSCRPCTPELRSRLWPSRTPSTPSPFSRARW
jgi:hypothetical protein